MAPSGPDYIFYGGAALPAPPYTCNDARFMSLPCAGDRSAIQDFVDRTLNAATRPGRFLALSKYVFLAIMTAEAGSATAPFSRYGTAAETDIGFWIPVSDTVASASIFWYPAYLFVDNWMSVIGGREIWGFPKAWAEIHVSPDDPRDGTIAVSTLAMKRLEPNARAAMAEIFRVTPGASEHPAAADSGGGALVEALRHFLQHAPLRDLIELVTMLARSSHYASEGARMLLLRQVRDAGSPTAAAHRSVVAANATVTTLRRGPWLKGEHWLTLNDFASQPIAADLGLVIGEQALPFAVCADVDVTMGLAAPVPLG